MLTELRIRNFAIIDQLTLSLAPGFNVLSGETGAGKSIIVGALGMLLGERASTDLIRTGADRASVEGLFDIAGNPELVALLDERGIDVDESLVVLKREVATAGRTRAWINGTSVSATVLADVGRHLVNLHGQHEAQTLLDADAQRAILDAFAGASELAARVAAAHQAWGAVRRDIAGLTLRRAEAERRADYLRHVVKEVEDAHLTDGEDARLEDEGRRLEHAEELRTMAQGILALIEADEDAILHRLGTVQRQLAGIRRIDPSLARLQELFDAAFYNTEALAREIETYESTVDLDPERLSEVRVRRDVIYRLTQKYGPTLAEAMAAGRAARDELDLVDGAGLDLLQLEKREREAHERLAALAGDLSARRRDAADRLSAAVDAVFPDVGMTDGHFSVALSPLDEVAAAGGESVGFCVALNVGHDARPLARVASGGELSRVMLALKTILARLDRVPTLIFDEVDAGIGGRVGLLVGETMRRVAEFHQVFAISHLPQIAARAHHHIQVSKDARGGVTTADVRVLAGEERVNEIARMLGGDSESEVSRAHARELLDAAHPVSLVAGNGAATRPAARTAAGAPRQRRSR